MLTGKSKMLISNSQLLVSKGKMLLSKSQLLIGKSKMLISSLAVRAKITPSGQKSYKQDGLLPCPVKNPARRRKIVVQSYTLIRISDFPGVSRLLRNRSTCFTSTGTRVHRFGCLIDRDRP